MALTVAELKKQFFMDKKNGGLILTPEQVEAADAFCEDYKAFLDAAKTEREAVDTLIREAEAKGFVPYENGRKLMPGDRVYLNNRNKALILAVIGEKSLTEGVNLTASHIDAPRIDLKQVPLYESCDLALFKTHYYGGVKKYQWTAIPLALHGVVVKADGSTVTVTIGEDESDPVFCITDLLPHLASEQMKRSAPEIIKGEELNLLIGSRPFRDDEASDRVKLNIAAILMEKYGITEADFLSAELEIVPAFKAKDVGLDRSMVGAYGQDDRVCAYTSARALLDLNGTPEKTMMALMADKEEIGSCGATGMKGAFLKYFIDEIAEPHGIPGRRVLAASKCLSADVSAAVDPTFADAHEALNAAYLNRGTTIMKFTGSRGKGGSNDASAELMGHFRRMLDEAGVIWQTAELGRVDLGGGGTVAAYIAELDVDTIDIGVPVLSMHAPFEVTSKIDIYETYRAFCAFSK